ncbi:MAG: DUF760 domain-containing protein [Phormidesmis sp. RL_2_1]|nr:DUF760 domain-containing protein [Phormidesmis sp. RL_2_1]
MDNVTGKLPEFMNSNSAKENALLSYVRTMDEETISQLSRPDSNEVMQVMEHNVIGLLGGLPSGQFDVSVTTNRENLGRLLASAMMSGYFLRGAEQRLAFEEQFMGSFDSTSDNQA